MSSRQMVVKTILLQTKASLAHQFQWSRRDTNTRCPTPCSDPLHLKEMEIWTFSTPRQQIWTNVLRLGAAPASTLAFLPILFRSVPGMRPEALHPSFSVSKCQELALGPTAKSGAMNLQIFACKNREGLVVKSVMKDLVNSFFRFLSEMQTSGTRGPEETKCFLHLDV